MADRKKIFRRILIALTWLLVLGYMGVALGFVNKKEKQLKCSKIEIRILDNTDNSFVEEDDVLEIFKDKNIDLIGKPINNINIAKLEALLYQHPSIKKVDVFKEIVKINSNNKTEEGVLKIEIYQRNPITRVINKNSESYYIDEDAKLMPISDKYTAHVLVINGNINQTYTANVNKNLSVPTNGDLSNDSLLNDIFTIGKYIWNNTLWKAQIEQIYINENNEMEMVPRIGTQSVQFGTIENMEEKFTKLEAIYSQGFNNVGWNKYKDINLKFKNLVICTKIE